MVAFEILIKILAVGSFLFSAFSIWQNSKYNRKQWNLNAFTYYTNRYESIMDSFPQDAFIVRFDLESHVKSSQDLRLAALKYLNMTSEEYYLWKDGYLDEKLWKIWLHEIKRTLETPLFIREWQNLRAEFASYPEFSNFVDKIQSSTSFKSIK
ncbi:MAG: hypothetical protein ACFCVD_24050 [Nodosilinea sp.]